MNHDDTRRKSPGKISPLSLAGSGVRLRNWGANPEYVSLLGLSLSACLIDLTGELPKQSPLFTSSYFICRLSWLQLLSVSLLFLEAGREWSPHSLSSIPEPDSQIH